MFSQAQTAKYKKFNPGIQNPLSVISNDTMYCTLSRIFFFGILGAWWDSAHRPYQGSERKDEITSCHLHRTWNPEQQ